MVERGSTQHSGRVDDVLAEEVEPLVRSGSEPRARDDRAHEPAADDEPLPDVRIAGEDVPMPGLLDLDEIEARSRLAASLRPSAFPADREVLRAVAAEEYASPEVMEALDALPPGRRFVNVQQVWEALGGDRERRGGAQGATETAAIEPEPPSAARAEPIDTEIELELEAAAASPSPPERGDAWWVGPVRLGVGVALLPVRVSIGALRFARDRLRPPSRG
jgi:hypothetical protein